MSRESRETNKITFWSSAVPAIDSGTVIIVLPFFPQCFPHANNKKRQTVLHTFNSIFPIFKVSYQTQTSLRNVARAALCTHTDWLLCVWNRAKPHDWHLQQLRHIYIHSLPWKNWSNNGSLPVGDLSASHLCNDVYASQPAADGVWLLLTFLWLYLFFSSARACWAIEMICTEQWNTTTKRKARPVFYFETPFIVTQQSSSDSSTVREIIKRAVYIIVCVSKEQRILLTRKRPNEKDMYPAIHRRALNKKKTKKSNAFDCFSLFRNNALHASANARKTNGIKWGERNSNFKLARVAFGQGVDHRRLPAHPTLCESGIGEGREGISFKKKCYT